ncbi:hypothetical protein GF324_04205 [bacterium]|nr:hypothetical protein [bacterium]
MSEIRIGMRREDKSDSERRAPITPDDMRRLIDEHGYRFFVERSMPRIYKDMEFQEAGTTLVNELPEVHLVVGIKEVPVARLMDNTPHIFFSHVIKGQPENMPMLQEILNRNITLIDYEKITRDNGFRLIAFGVQAGQAGMVNSLWSYGQRMSMLGFDTPFADLRQAREYDSLDAIFEDLHSIKRSITANGLPEGVPPLVVGVTGHGRVSQGAIDVLEELDPVELTPAKLVEKVRANELSPNEVYKVVFYPWDLYRLKKRGPIEDFLQHTVDMPATAQDIDLPHLFDHADEYDAYLEPFLPHLSVLVNGTYWDVNYPRLVTRDGIREIYERDENPRLTVIGDVACDIDGGIEITVKETYPENPVYVYNPVTGVVNDGFAGPGILMMAVTILPAELPRESSVEFSEVLRGMLPDLVNADYGVPFDELKLPEHLKRAVIAHKGELTPDYQYIQAFLDANAAEGRGS